MVISVNFCDRQFVYMNEKDVSFLEHPTQNPKLSSVLPIPIWKYHLIISIGTNDSQTFIIWQLVEKSFLDIRIPN